MALLACIHPLRAQGQQPLPAPVPDRTDCNRPESHNERYLCESRHLRWLQDRLADAVDKLAAASPRGVALREEQAAWNRRILRGPGPAPVDLRSSYIERLREVERIAALTSERLQQAHSASALKQDCVAPPPPSIDLLGLRCKIEEATEVDGRFVQMQSWEAETGPDPGLGPINGVLVFERQGSPPDGSDETTYRLVAWAVEEHAFVSAPKPVATGPAGEFLSIPRQTNGSSPQAFDAVFHRSGPGQPWTEIDATTWQSALGRRVPRGTYPKLGYDLDLATLTLTMDLARDSDANCCPTGGKAHVKLALRGNQLVVDTVRIEPMLPVQPAAPPRPAETARTPGRGG